MSDRNALKKTETTFKKNTICSPADIHQSDNDDLCFRCFPKGIKGNIFFKGCKIRQLGKPQNKRIKSNVPCKTLHSICTVVSVQCKNGVIILATIKHSTTCTPGLTMTIICFWLDEDKDKSLAAFCKTLWTAEGMQKRVMTRSKDERKTSKYGRVNDNKKNKKNWENVSDSKRNDRYWLTGTGRGAFAIQYFSSLREINRELFNDSLLNNMINNVWDMT